jgi:hypothetical protein
MTARALGRKPHNPARLAAVPRLVMGSPVAGRLFAERLQ